MDSLREDLRFAFRSLLKNRSFTVIALAVLALGIGANSAICSVVYTVLVKPLPYRDADRLMIANVSYPERKDLEQAVDGFDAISIWGTNLYTLATDGDAEQIRGVVATTPSCTTTLPHPGAPPSHGTLFNGSLKYREYRPWREVRPCRRFRRSAAPVFRSRMIQRFGPRTLSV